MSIEQMLEQMYYSDFNEKGAIKEWAPIKEWQEISKHFGWKHKEEWEPLWGSTAIQTERYSNPK